MMSDIRERFNAAFSDAFYARYMSRLEARVGHIPFRVAETPLFLSHALRDRLVGHALALVEQLSAPEMIARCKRAIPERFDAPNMDALPNTVQVDFALVPGKDGALDGQLIEMQGFPSLYAFMPLQAELWNEQLAEVPGLDLGWTGLFGESRAAGLDLIRRTLLGGFDPLETALVDIDPEHQKTRPDFLATQQLFGIESVCITQLFRRGRQLWRRRANGQEVQVKRFYNRVVFDELMARGVQTAFDFRDDLDVSYCSHPNWYWAWSKFCLPLLDHACVPRSRLVSELDFAALPDDLSGFVLKPLFSFAGGGVVIDVTRAALDAVPERERANWVLQDKIAYAPALTTPAGNPVKAEVRVMLARPPDQRAFEPALLLVRLSRGKMCGVDFNKDLDWVGGTVGMWLEKE